MVEPTRLIEITILIKVLLEPLIWRGMCRSGYQIGTGRTITGVPRPGTPRVPHLGTSEYFEEVLLNLVFGFVIYLYFMVQPDHAEAIRAEYSDLLAALCAQHANWCLPEQ